MNLILLGAPGAGKGTQAGLLSEELSIPTISTGNIIRQSLKNGSPEGLAAKEYVDKGELVPDEVVINIIKRRLSEPDCERGFILDGFPRTAKQAEALDKMGIKIDKVISIEVEDDWISDRMAGRRVCEKCGSSYHLKNNKPAIKGVCDKCGDKLIRRLDDNPITVKDRLRVYHEQTEPLKDYYDNQNKLTKIIDNNNILQTNQMILVAIKG